MAREPKTTEPKPAEDEPALGEPTRPQPIDENGRVLDEHGLPINGPARQLALGGKPDPRDAAQPAPPAPTDSQD